MGNNYYSPNAKLTGGALFASFNSKEGSIYFKLIRQIANNPDKKGNFDGKNPLNIKLSQDEAADIIRAVRTNGEAKFFHKFNNDTTTGSFKYYFIKATEQGKSDRQGFVFSVKRSGAASQEVKIGFTLASGERLSLFLQNALVHIFDAEYSQDLKDFRESQEKKNKQPAPVETEQEEEPEPVQSTESEDDFMNM